MIDQSLIIKVEEKIIVLLSLWSDDMDIKKIKFFETVTLEVLTKKVVHFNQLRHWQKTDVIRKLLPYYPNITYWEISK